MTCSGGTPAEPMRCSGAAANAAVGEDGHGAGGSRAGARHTDPLVKEERIRLDGGVLLDRARRSAKPRDADGRPVTHAFDL